MPLTTIIVFFLHVETLQLCTALFGGGGREVLGLARGVQPQEIDLDLACQRQIMGEMNSTVASIIAAIFDIYTLVKATTRLPVTSYAVGDSLRSRLAPVVVPPLDRHSAADRTHSNGSKVTPAFGLEEPLIDLERWAAPDLFEAIATQVSLARAHEPCLDSELGAQDRLEALLAVAGRVEHGVARPSLQNCLEIVGPGQHFSHHHRQQFAQNIPRQLLAALALQYFKHFNHRHQVLGIHYSAKTPANYINPAVGNRDFVGLRPCTVLSAYRGKVCISGSLGNTLRKNKT
ncbi:MAG: hypothetical protein KC594_18960 [Nitrospira sp.]|nr:hypothetical protein [Nitrospira sp.]